MRTRNLSLIGILFILITFFGCSNDVNNTPVSFSKYLTINHGIECKTLSKSEQKTLYKAFSRLDVCTTEDGFIVLNTKSGKDINISENIYNYYKDIIGSFNKNVGINIRTRFYFSNDSTATGDMELEVDSAGCLLYCIQDVMNSFGKYIPYEEIKQNLINHNLYDNGVAAEDAYKALGLYFKVNRANPPYDEQNVQGRHYIMSIWQDIQNEERQYHAVEYLASNKGVVIYYDPQRGCNGVCDMNQIFQFFYVTQKF